MLNFSKKVWISS